MSNSMVERVARALANKMTGWEPDWPTYQYAAVAAIEAMREPTEAMRFAGITNNFGRYADEAWRAMIDEALR